MPKRITHDMAKEQDLVFEYSPDPAYLAVVDLDSYAFFVRDGLEYREMLSHLNDQMIQRRCVAWGCPQANLRVRVVFTRDHKASQSVTEYASAFQRWVCTQGRLCFASHNDLFHCATNPEWSVFHGPESPDNFLPRELLVPAGTYSLIVFRHFGWFEGEQDVPLLGEGIHYTVVLRHYEDESLLAQLYPPSPVPWT
jgi:hypothetical protein